MIIVTLCLCSLLSFAASSAFAQWNQLATGSMKNLFGVHFMNERKGFVTGWDSKSGVILLTYDAGKTWTPTYAVGNYIFGTTSTDSLHLYTVGQQGGCQCGLIMKSSDGGLHWDQSTDGTTFGYYAIAFSDELNGYAVGYQGVVTVTTDGGVSWNDQSLGDGTDAIKNVSFPSKMIGYAVSDSANFSHPHRIWKTTDAGASWNKIQDYGTHLVIASMAWTSPTVGFFCGNDGASCIYETSDGGSMWKAVNRGNPSIVLQGIAFGHGNDDLSKIGYAVGDNGTVVRSINGGSSWHEEQSGSIETLTAVDIPSATEVFIGGSNGVVIERAGVQAVAPVASAVEKERFMVAPNPIVAGNTLRIAASSGKGQYNVEIVDMLGNVVHHSTFSSRLHEISFAGMHAGTYLYRIWNASGNLQTGKLEVAPSYSVADPRNRTRRSSM